MNIRLKKLLLASLCALTAFNATADVVKDDDLIVQGSACIGFDCVDGEDFVANGDTLRLKENNTRVRFFDTSAPDIFGNSWELEANRSNNGGGSGFAIAMKSLTEDTQLISDGTHSITYTDPDTFELITVIFPAGEPVIHPITGEPTLTYNFESLLEFGVVGDLTPTVRPLNAVTIGFGSEPVMDTVSIGRADLLRQLKHVATAMADTDLINLKQLNDFSTFAEQEATIAAAEARLAALEASVDNLEAQVVLAECFDCEVETNTGGGSWDILALSLLLGFVLYRKSPKLALAFVLTASFTQAATAAERPWHLGLSYGQSDLSPESDNFRVKDGKDMGYKLSLAYQMDRNWALEGFWSDLGETTIQNRVNVNDLRHISYENYGLGVVYSFHMDQRSTWEFLVRGGYASISTDSSDVILSEKGSNRIYLGIGLEYELNRDWDLRFEYDSFSDDSKLASFGIFYSF